MTDEQKTKLKWTYLLEKMRLGIQVTESNSYFSYSSFAYLDKK